MWRSRVTNPKEKKMIEAMFVSGTKSSVATEEDIKDLLECFEYAATSSKYITFRWYSCKTSGTETVREQNYEAQKNFLKEVYGAYRFEIIETR
jgi:hypothetical protein